MYRERWKGEIGGILTQTTIAEGRHPDHTTTANSKGVGSRITRLARDAVLWPKLPEGKKRYTVPINHRFRKYFNIMMRRAKVNYLDKENIMGHSVGLEEHYE